MAIVKKFTRAELESIYSAANSAIWHSHHIANVFGKHRPREEDYVATLVTAGVSLLADRWIPLLSPKGIALRVSGVFCHGHPQVAFGASAKTVELADLLVVHQHVGKIRATCRALLIQAKMSIDATHRLPSGDLQLDLFSNWPMFEFVTGGLAPGPRDLRETGKGSRYALVLTEHVYPEDITWADQCPWAACRAEQLLSAERSFAKILGNIMVGKDGRVVRLVWPRDDWSRTIKELLEITGRRIYKRANIGLGKLPRRSSVGLLPAGVMFFSQTTTYAGSADVPSRQAISDRFFGNVPVGQDNGEGDEPPSTEVRDDRRGGMSLLIIETREIDQ